MAISVDSFVLTEFFIALLLLIFAAHLFGHLFSKLHMPRVVAEIFGGLLLGPTFLGWLAPNFFQTIFLNHGELLAVIYWLGLVLLMFCSGFEIERTFEDKKTVLVLVAATTIIPFIFGWISTSFFDLSSIIGTAQDVLAL